MTPVLTHLARAETRTDADRPELRGLVDELAVAASSQASKMLTPALMRASRAAARRASASECRAVPKTGMNRTRASTFVRQASLRRS